MVTGNYLPFNFHSLFFLNVFFYGGAFMFRLFGFFICAFPFLVASLSCDSTEPPAGSGAKFTLAVEDSSCTEVWLKLTTSNIPLPVTLSLEQNNIVSQTISLCCKDTLLYIDSLLPKQTYKFKAVLTDYQQPTSNEVTAQTLDTTSHNFSWQSWEFGEHSSSVLYDVAIIDENNIWAVGEIYMNDSLGNPDPNAYNAVHWDGSKWELKRIMFYTICGQQNLSSYPARSIWVFNENDIWIGVDGDQITRLENEVQTTTICLPWSFTINKIWGTSSEDLYVVGNGGNIARYFKPIGHWQKLDGDTNLDIYDIIGSVIEANQYEVLCVAAKQFVSTEKKVFKIIGNTIYELSANGIPTDIKSIWFKSNKKYYVVGSGMFSKTNINSTQPWKSIWEGITEYYTNSIDGNNYNDIIVCGAYGEMIHFNGTEWKSFREELQIFDGSYLEVKIKGNLVVAVGYNSSDAIVTIGTR